MTLEPWTFWARDSVTREHFRVDVTPEHIESARQLVEEGWYQVSRTHRLVARLPDGMTGTEALEAAEAQGGHTRLAGHLEESGAGETYLSTYAARHMNQCVLDHATFAAFRKLGGGKYTYTRKEAA